MSHNIYHEYFSRNIIIATHPSLSTHHKLVTFNWLLHYPLKQVHTYMCYEVYCVCIRYSVVTGRPYNTVYHTSLITMTLLLYSLPLLTMLVRCASCDCNVFLCVTCMMHQFTYMHYQHSYPSVVISCHIKHYVVLFLYQQLSHNFDRELRLCEHQ